MKSPHHQSIGRDVGGDWPWSIQSHALSILFSCKMWWVGKCNPQGGYSWQIELQYPVFWFKRKQHLSTDSAAISAIHGTLYRSNALNDPSNEQSRTGRASALPLIKKALFRNRLLIRRTARKSGATSVFSRRLTCQTWLYQGLIKHHQVLSCIQRGHPVHNRQSAVMTLNQNGGAVLKHSAQHLAIKEWDTMWIKPYHLWILMIDWKINWETNQGQMSTENPPPPWSNDRMAWCFAIECCMAIKIKLGAPQVLAIWTIKNTWWVNRGFILVGFLEIIITHYNP